MKRILPSIIALAGVGVVVRLGRPSFGGYSTRLLVWVLIVAAYAILAALRPARSRALAWAPVLALVPGIALLSWPLSITGALLGGVLAVFLVGYVLRVRGSALGDLLITIAAALLVGQGPRWGYIAAVVLLGMVVLSTRPAGDATRPATPDSSSTS